MNSTDEPLPPIQSRSAPGGLATASLVLGILAVVLSFVLIGAFLGLVGLILGAIHIKRSRAGKAAGFGIGLSILGIVASAGFGIAYYKAYEHFQEIMAHSGHDGNDLSQWEGVLAPDLTVTTLDGQTLKLSDLRGKRVVLDFWATWCPPCVKEIPHFIELHDKTSRDQLVIVGISDEDTDTLKAFAAKHKVNYPIASPDHLPPPYGDIESIPTTFFIDRNGVIQSVAVGYHDLAALTAMATAKDFEGAPKSEPERPASGIQESSAALTPVGVWSKSLPGASALCAGDWDGDGVPDILVANQDRMLAVLGLDGVEKATLRLPARFTQIECGRAKDGAPRLLGYVNWGSQVSVMDATGTELWSYAAGSGVDGAHWGDLDGDGGDELIVGMNGGGGLHAVAEGGKTIWSVKNIGNVWNQAVIPAKNGRPAMVFATEAGGTVRVFDAAGKPLRTIRPNGRYSSQMSAAVTDDAGTVQGIVIGDGSAIAFDETGRVAWSTPSVDSPGSWRSGSFACGDVDGDGIREWAFLDNSGGLAVASVTGEKVACLPAQQKLDGFQLVSRTNERGLLVTLQGGRLQAHTFE